MSQTRKSASATFKHPSFPNQNARPASNGGALNTMDKNETILRTIDRINKALESDPNALTSGRDNVVAPEFAYIELIRELIALADK